MLEKSRVFSRFGNASIGVASFRSGYGCHAVTCHPLLIRRFGVSADLRQCAVPTNRGDHIRTATSLSQPPAGRYSEAVGGTLGW
jgi:hypothetical protein